MSSSKVVRTIRPKLLLQSIQWIPGDPKVAEALKEWMGSGFRVEGNEVAVKVKVGYVSAKQGDWIIRHPQGNFSVYTHRDWTEGYEDVTDGEPDDS